MKIDYQIPNGQWNSVCLYEKNKIMEFEGKCMQTTGK